MPPRRLVTVALVAEGALALAAIGWAVYREIPLRLGPVALGTASGLAAAAAFAAANLYLLRGAPALPGVRSIRRLYEAVLRPLFAGLGAADLVAISAVAGIGEELFFRGAVQPEIGLLPASLLFGAMHLGGSGTLAFGCWAAVLGLALGWLATVTGGLLAPIVAHAVYDALALAYIRKGRDGQEIC